MSTTSSICFIYMLVLLFFSFLLLVIYNLYYVVNGFVVLFELQLHYYF
jgi:hypothetical protein